MRAARAITEEYVSRDRDWEKTVDSDDAKNADIEYLIEIACMAANRHCL
jgi:hypothetical protein